MNMVTLAKTGMVFFILLLATLGLSAQEYSLYMNGNGQYANCGSSPDFNFSNALTVEAWIYPSDFTQPEHMHTIVAKSYWDPNSYGWALRYGSANGVLNFNMSAGGTSWINCMAEYVLTLYTWQHVAATYDGAEIKLYVNGTLVATQPFTGGIINADNDLCIGTINHADMRYMAGKIDDVRIWNVARTAEEIYAYKVQSVTGPNLVAYYQMNSGSGNILTDDSGNGHTAELFGSPTWISELPRRYSLQLNGSGQYANCGSSPDFNFSNALTVEAWIYPTDFKAEVHMNTIVAKTSWSNDYSHGWTLRYGSTNRSLNFNMGGGTGGSWIDCKADYHLTLNTWQHVAATYDGQWFRLYVNGNQVASKFFSGSITNADNDLCIGTTNHGDMRYMTGRIDEVRIWNVARSASEISNNMRQSVISTNLVAHYQMTDGSGTILTDNSGHGHTGTLVGNPNWSSNDYSNMPFVRTEETTSIGAYSATANGTIISLGYPYPIQHGHCWKIGDENPTINDSKTQLGPIGTTGAFSSSMTDLAQNTLYWVRSYVTNIIGGVETISYGISTPFRSKVAPPPTPSALDPSNITTSSFIANWRGFVWDKYYEYRIDISTNYDFSSYVSGYRNKNCGNQNADSSMLHYLVVTGLEAGVTYYYRIRSVWSSQDIFGQTSYYYSPYSNIEGAHTIPIYSVAYNTGNITGVRIYASGISLGIDPPSPLRFIAGYNVGTILAEKNGYTWSLAEGSDSNIISYIYSNRNISFIGTYRLVDPANPGFVYQGEPDIPISLSNITLEDLSVPPPPVDPEDAIVLNFSATAPSDITISAPAGVWYAIAYYNDPADGGFAWHHANPYPATGPQNIVFSNLPFGAKSEIPLIISMEDVTLPVELSSFTAMATANNCITLSWVTQSETNLLGFMIFRNTMSALNTASNISSLISAVNSSQTTLYSFEDGEAEMAVCYYYWLQIVHLDGSQSFQGPISITIGDPGHNIPPAIPLETRLLPSYPNPFNPSTTVHYELRTPDIVSFRIYNCKGQLVATHSQTHAHSGRFSWVFYGMDKQGQALASGVYLCVMNTRDKTFVNKMMLAK